MDPDYHQPCLKAPTSSGPSHLSLKTHYCLLSFKHRITRDSCIGFFLFNWWENTFFQRPSWSSGTTKPELHLQADTLRHPSCYAERGKLHTLDGPITAFCSPHWEHDSLLIPAEKNNRAKRKIGRKQDQGLPDATTFTTPLFEQSHPIPSSVH